MSTCGVVCVQRLQRMQVGFVLMEHRCNRGEFAGPHHASGPQHASSHVRFTLTVQAFQRICKSGTESTAALILLDGVAQQTCAGDALR